MTLDRFLNVLAAVFGTLGAIYVMVGILAMSPDLMARLAAGAWGFSREQVKALAGQKGDNVAGFAFVILAFVLSTVTLVAVPDGVVVFDGRRCIALTVIAAASAGTFITLRLIGGAITRHQSLAIGKVIASWFLDELIKRGRVETYDLPSFPKYAELLGLDVIAEESGRSVLARIAAKVGKTLPGELDYSAVEHET